MNEALARLKRLENQIHNSQNLLAKMKKYILVLIPIGIAFSFLYPLVPGRRGKESLAIRFGYLNAVMFSAVIIFIFLPIAYFMKIKNLKTKIKDKKKEHKLLKYRIENESHTL